jgi:hypothetical protein
MGYLTKEQDYDKRKNREGSYSVYNFMYHYLLSNYEPENLESSFACEAAEFQLVNEGKKYLLKAGIKFNENELKQTARTAITNFCDNDGKHGDSAGNFGHAQENQFKNIKKTISDLR